MFRHQTSLKFPGNGTGLHRKGDEDTKKANWGNLRENVEKNGEKMRTNIWRRRDNSKSKWRQSSSPI